jgi:hypothetical protein
MSYTDNLLPIRKANLLSVDDTVTKGDARLVALEDNSAVTITWNDDSTLIRTYQAMTGDMFFAEEFKSIVVTSGSLVLV